MHTHYQSEHGLPLNLFSIAVSDSLRLWYIAPKHVRLHPKKTKSVKEK